jgi:hypothetical protein
MTPTTIYTVPEGVTTIVLGAMASNFGIEAAAINFTLVKNETEFVVLNNFEIPTNDAADLTNGKLILEQGNEIKASSSLDTTLNIILSLLETSNE